MTGTHRLPSTQANFLSECPRDLPERHRMSWLVGEFFFQLSSLETEITDWVAVAVRGMGPVYTHVMFRETNLSHKMRVVGFLIEKKMFFSGNWKDAKGTIEEISKFRNLFAHGAIAVVEDKIDGSMPSQDGLYSMKRRYIDQSDVLDLISRMSALCRSFNGSANEHIQRLNLAKKTGNTGK
jgi:hypothetical protein